MFKESLRIQKNICIKQRWTFSAQATTNQSMSASSTDSFPTHSRNAMLTDDIFQGDWFRTKSSVVNHFGKSRPQCFEYCIPPRVGWGIPKSSVQLSPLPLPTSLYLGPVHGEPEHFGDYVTICVPSHRVENKLCWINVRKGNVIFADQVTEHEIAHWLQRGWVNRYLDTSWMDDQTSLART